MQKLIGKPFLSGPHSGHSSGAPWDHKLLRDFLKLNREKEDKACHLHRKIFSMDESVSFISKGVCAGFSPS
jgi:hypothetical protein